MKYYNVIGDSSSGTHELPWEEATALAKALSLDISAAYRAGYEQNYSIQLKSAKLLSISYHCLGGAKPMFKGNGKVFFPLWLKEEYVFNYIKHYMYFIKKFDENKAPWGFYCRWIKSLAIRDTIAKLRKLDREKEALEALKNALAIYVSGDSRMSVTMSKVYGDSDNSEEYFTSDMMEQYEENGDISNLGYETEEDQGDLVDSLAGE